MDKLKLAFIGAWGHGQGAVEYFRKETLPEVELAGLAQTHEQEGCWDLPDSYDEVPRYENYQQMLTEVKPDLVVVSSKLQYIHQAVLSAAENGCHVLAEKPIAASFSELDNLYDAVQRNKGALLLLLNNRANPYLKAVKNTVEEGIVGDPVLVNGRKSYPWNPSRVDNFPIRLGGTIGWVGIHAFDIINGATNLTFNQAVGMESNQIFSEYAQCPDNTAMVSELENGGHATISLDYHRPKASSTHGDDWIRVVGLEGTIEANLSQQTIHCCTDKQSDRKITLPETEDYYRQYFAYLRNGDWQERFTPMTALTLHMTAACITAQEAVQSGTVKEIPAKYKLKSATQ